MIIAGDIGGTNTRLVCAEKDEEGRQFRFEKDYLNANFSSFTPILESFFSEAGVNHEIASACFAVAGPVITGQASITNLPWVISENEICQHFHISKVKLINDFIAVGYGIDRLSYDDILVLQQGSSDRAISSNPDAAIIGAGTGLGVAHRVWLQEQYQVFSSEAGHVGFAPENEVQTRLLGWLQKTNSHVSLETILSGRGLLTIYHFFHEEDGVEETEGVRQAMSCNDPAQVITENALIGNDVLCQMTLECFTDIYGAAAGNAALHYYPVDELYIAGGIAPRIRQKLLPDFVEAFSSKGLMSDNMRKITIKLILNDKVGLSGAEYIAANLIDD